VTPTAEFRRARRPEQVATRRAAILCAARELLALRRSSAVSLGDISERAGLAKSNVLRYFDSREAILLEVLDTEWREWLDKLAGTFPGVGPGSSSYAVERLVATHIADSLAEQHLLCELISVMAGVLERNIQIDYARDFKRRAAENTDRLATFVQDMLPVLPDQAAHQFAGAVFIVTAGLWPYAQPTDVIATVSAEMGVGDSLASFRDNLREGLAAQLIGLVVQAIGQTTA
jgi:AcrR family transcriptional regulator